MKVKSCRAPCRCVVGPRGRLSCSRDPLESSSYRNPGLKTEGGGANVSPRTKIHGIYDIWYLYDSLWGLNGCLRCLWCDCYNHRHLKHS
jgi:hypothetical protein